MKIISPFKDYYDNASSRKIDDGIKYYRKTTTDTINDKNIPRSSTRNGYWSNGFDLNFIGFAGVVFPYLSFYENDKVIRIDFDRDRILNNYNYKTWENKSFVDRLHKFIDDTSLFEKYGAIFEIRSEPYHYSWTHQLTINGKLPFGFVKVLGPTEANEMLFKYLCNKSSSGPNIPEMKNDDKIVLAGFNTKYSFRKEKQN
jgi:hypothetical protein